jgi:nicotinamide mononucleotide transporter
MTPLADALGWANQIVFTIARDHVTWAELLGFVTGVAAVWLAAVRHMWNWPVGIANSAFFGLLFLDARLYADASLQVVYIVLGVFGWWAWLRLGPEQTRLDVRPAGRLLLLATSLGVAAATLVLVPVLRAAHDSAPTLDALTTAISLGAQFLLCLKRVENWYWWITVDLIYIPLYLSRGLALTAAVYVVFLVICVRAVPAWQRAARATPAGSAT